MAAKSPSVHAPRENSKKKPLHPGWMLAGFALAIVALTGLMFTPWFKDIVETAAGWAENLMDANPVLGAIAFFIFSALSAMLAFASSAMLVPPANLAWGKPLTFVLLTTGWLTGAIATYYVGRLAHPLLMRMGYGPKLAQYKKFVSARMPFWAVLLVCVAIPSEIPGYLFGSAHYPFFKFAAAMGIAEAVYALAMVIMGESLIEAEPGVMLGVGAALIVVAVAAMLILRKTQKGNA
jgi:uncharacterized membrane protein YdjX (TVP38/TMEM64 family)